ncbi:MAG: hypothetical protein WCK58_01465 [Chloroflexota bacterium]
MIVGARREPPYAALILAIGFPLLFAAGIALRLWLWPTAGVAADLDRLARWVHDIVTSGLPRAYDGDLSQPPVIAATWALLGALEPAFRTAADATDPAIRALLKVPASIADIGIAAAALWWFRDRPGAALVAVAVALLWPAGWYLSSWWGDIDALWILPAVIALLAARAGRPVLVAAFLALAVAAGQQAMVLVVPFLAWSLGAKGIRRTARAIVVGGVVMVVAWVPCIAAGGPAAYLRNVAAADAALGGTLSAGAWNPWWVVGRLGAGGDTVTAATAVLGPLSFADVGSAMAALLVLAVFVAVLRNATGERLALGAAAVLLVAFTCRTTMPVHDGLAAAAFLLFAVAGRGTLLTALAFGVALTVNLVVVAPPAGIVPPDVPAIGVAGAAVMSAVTLAAVVLLARRGEQRHDKVWLG